MAGCGEPRVTNVYLGPFWGDRGFFEGFSKSIVENGYLNPLKQLGLRERLGYGSGLGSQALIVQWYYTNEQGNTVGAWRNAPA